MGWFSKILCKLGLHSFDYSILSRRCTCCGLVEVKSLNNNYYSSKDVSEIINRLTQEDSIRNALDLYCPLEVYDNLLETGMTNISFASLSKCVFATKGIDSLGNPVIKISDKYQNSHPLALACLITHESYHKLNTPTLEEEILCTTREANLWRNYNYGAVYEDDELTKRLNYLLKNIDSIPDIIRDSSFYKDKL